MWPETLSRSPHRRLCVIKQEGQLLFLPRPPSPFDPLFFLAQLESTETFTNVGQGPPKWTQVRFLDLPLADFAHWLA